MIGLLIYFSGEESGKLNEVWEFVKWFEVLMELLVVFFDEWFMMLYVEEIFL